MQKEGFWILPAGKTCTVDCIDLCTALLFSLPPSLSFFSTYQPTRLSPLGIMSRITRSGGLPRCLLFVTDKTWMHLCISRLTTFSCDPSGLTFETV